MFQSQVKIYTISFTSNYCILHHSNKWNFCCNFYFPVRFSCFYESVQVNKLWSIWPHIHSYREQLAGPLVCLYQKKKLNGKVQIITIIRVCKFIGCQVYRPWIYTQSGLFGLLFVPISWSKYCWYANMSEDQVGGD